MKKIVLPLSLLTVLCMMLSGCSRYVHPALPLENPYGFQMDSMAVAVDSYGMKHIAIKECLISNPLSCYLAYLQMINGETNQIWSWASTTQYLGIGKFDIAVTDGGTAAVVWETINTSGGDYTTLSVVGDDFDTFGEIEPGAVANNPMVVAKGGALYAVQNASISGHWSIWYRQLVGGTSSGWVSDHNGANDNTLFDAAVSPSGNLYVTWWRATFGDIMYADNYGTTGEMTNRFGLVASAYDYSLSRIDVNGSPETVYITYTHLVSPSNLLVIGHCPAASCSFGTYAIELPLNAALNWSIGGVTDIIADAGTTAYYVFSATNSGTGSNAEVFEGYFKNGLPYFTANVSNTVEADGIPTIGLMWSVIPVSSWVTGNDIYQFDAYPFTANAYASLRKIHHTSYTILSGSDMSCDADWGAGTWIEAQASNQGYVIFNTYPAMMPLIKK
jgi:hypothetical protein